MEMKPEFKRRNILQTLITIALIVILGGVLALYIYYGMYQARQAAPVAEVAVPLADEASPENAMDDVRKREIIEALNQQPIATDEAKTQEIINSLQQNPIEPDTVESEQRRAEIIKALQQN